MSDPNELCALGLRHHQADDIGQAETLYHQVLKADPNHAEAHHLIGVLALQARNFHAARDWIERAISLNPSDPSFHNNLGLVFQSLGQLENAQASYGEALRLAPAHRTSVDNLGALLLRHGKPGDVVAMCRRALSECPDLPEAFQKLAQALEQLGKLEEARTQFQEALRLQPDSAETNYNFGMLLFNLGRPADAVTQYQQAFSLGLQSPELHYHLGRALFRQGEMDEAVTHFRTALSEAPHNSHAYNDLGSALAVQFKFEEAIDCYRRAIEIDPLFAEACANLGAALARSGRSDEAVAICRQAIDLDPRNLNALNNLGCALLDLGDLTGAAASFRIALEVEPGLVGAQSNLLFCLNHSPKLSPDEVFAKHRRWGQQQSAVPSPALRFESRPEPSRLRIGYVSPDFHEHAIVRYIEPVLANHNVEKIEVFCYANVSTPDHITRRLQQYAHQWRSIHGQAATQAAQQIRLDGIDILVDLTGHTAGNRLDVFVHKPAAIQATWLGYLNTTGLSQIDYRITDAVLDPPDQPRWDTEELWRLPRGFCCFQPRDNAPELVTLPALARGHLTFGSLHSLFKLNSEVYDLWCQVLHAIPTARILMYRDMLKGTALTRVVHEFEKRSIARTRLDLRSTSQDLNHLLVYSDIDVSLDTFPWTGGVTTCESLWMGVPMLSLAGVRPAARSSASILTQAGLGDFVCNTNEEFVGRVLRLNDELDQLAELRSGLRERMRRTLGDARRFTQELEDAYRSMWQRGRG